MGKVVKNRNRSLVGEVPIFLFLYNNIKRDRHQIDWRKFSHLIDVCPSFILTNYIKKRIIYVGNQYTINRKC